MLQAYGCSAKTVLLQEGDIAQKVFLIEKSCIRVWFNDNGKEITQQFFFENNTVASIKSFKKNCPSRVTIETIDPSVVWSIHKKEVERIIAEISDSPVMRDQFIDMLFERMFNYMKHFFSFIKDTLVQRYLNLVKEKPQLIQRVPQHYIASYLGISSLHLSR